MNIDELTRRTRSYRRFRQAPVSMETLRRLVALTRQAPTGGNRQPLKFALSADPRTNALIFPTLAWAGYLKDWPGPSERERPTAYAIILLDTDIAQSVGHDAGIAAWTLALGAMEQGIGSCMIGSVKREALAEALKIPPRYRVELVLALGYPDETVLLETVMANGDIKYYRDAEDVHHVPKRQLDDLIQELPKS